LELYGKPYVVNSNQLMHEPVFMIYPNPVTGDKIYFTPQEKEMRIHIVNIYGQLIKRLKDRHEISIGDLPPGAYFLSIGNNQPVSFIRK
jgi:hypothetical protein